MKKHFLAVLLVVVMCLTLFAGCSLVKVFEKDIQVVLHVNGEYYGTYTVNIFNNAVVSEPEAPEGTKFIGWTPQANWEELDPDSIVVSKNLELIRYDDVKDYIDGESLSVSLYAVFAVIPPKDLVVAWYNKEGTSGLNQEYMDAFTQNLYAFLTSQGYNTDEMEIDVRGYEGNVGPSCAAIVKDGDVDIMVGWSTTDNLQTTGGLTAWVDFVDNNSNITIGSKPRYAARVSDSELSVLVYNWILSEYGSANTAQDMPKQNTDPTPDPDPDPTPDPNPGPVKPDITIDPNAQYTLVIGWYAKTATSGLDENIIANFEIMLGRYLKWVGFNLDNVTITFHAYDDDKVAGMVTKILNDGDVDVLIGVGNNINSTEADDESGRKVEIIEKQGSIPMGGKDRYIAYLTDSELVKLVYDWLKTENGYESLASDFVVPDEPDPTPTFPDPDEQYTLVIGWYSKTSTSGLAQSQIDAFEIALKAYLQSLGFNLDHVTISFHAYDDDKVAGMVTKILNDGDVDVLIGVGNNINSTEADDESGRKVEIIEKQGSIPMGGKDRYIARVTDTELSQLVYEWLKTADAQASLA